MTSAAFCGRCSVASVLTAAETADTIHRRDFCPQCWALWMQALGLPSTAIAVNFGTDVERRADGRLRARRARPR